ncbi:elongation factor P hydroxylase [Alteromonas sp. a30]|uniref:elongation factor P hydroxylase n=1 Tax=Alteromonas sp. a30 TaxID=2730917 RepID=UPI0022822350|nr:elongation factor P hydroxylase [Alteromonas sp. a30]MCY7296573.1 elongation factor P hydroxylase [Alteromonas sp. a30]
MSSQHSYQTLIRLFNSTFYANYNTRLVKGEDEPVYLPADANCDHHRIIFAHGFFASALHETAHWLVAGAKRRELEDFGYWYCPDGRNVQQQAEFESVEVKPQAIEWMLSVAANFPFQVSVDNLSGAGSDRFAFQARVQQQVFRYLENGIPARTQRFIDALRMEYQTPELNKTMFAWRPSEIECV